ncbi:hypothetical protein ACFLTA_07860 [Bacteroidota bacterium]
MIIIFLHVKLWASGSIDLFNLLAENLSSAYIGYRMTDQEIIKWLLGGDVSIQYQVYRDLLSEERVDLKDRIESEGWGKRYLAARNSNGHWGRGFYQPKWISSHYTLLDLRNICISEKCLPVQETLGIIMKENKGPDGGINPSITRHNSDVCINGMALNYYSYFRWKEKDLKSIVDFILTQHMADGGFNCHSNWISARHFPRHSSLHTTLSILEGIQEYRQNHYSYRLDDLGKVEKQSIEFILQHRLFKSDKTGEIIKRDFLKLTWPSRWKYDILKALDYFRAAGFNYDKRMDDAIAVILKKRNKEGTWNLQANHPGATHFEMEKPGKPSSWNTLRALRVLRHFNI